MESSETYRTSVSQASNFYKSENIGVCAEAISAENPAGASKAAPSKARLAAPTSVSSTSFGKPEGLQANQSAENFPELAVLPNSMSHSDALVTANGIYGGFFPGTPPYGSSGPPLHPFDGVPAHVYPPFGPASPMYVGNRMHFNDHPSLRQPSFGHFVGQPGAYGSRMSVGFPSTPSFGGQSYQGVNAQPFAFSNTQLPTSAYPSQSAFLETASGFHGESQRQTRNYPSLAVNPDSFNRPFSQFQPHSYSQLHKNYEMHPVQHRNVYRHSTAMGPQFLSNAMQSNMKNTIQKPKGQSRVSQACSNCRSRKAKCDGIKPECGQCVAKGINCAYSIPMKRGRKKKQGDKVLTDCPDAPTEGPSPLNSNLMNSSTVEDHVS